MSTPETPRFDCHRAHVAMVTLVLWLLGVEVLPALHLASHDADHTHEHDGTIAHVPRSHEAEHEHGDNRGARSGSEHSSLAFDDFEEPHTAAGIAHHAVAIVEASVPAVAGTVLPYVTLLQRPTVAVVSSAPSSWFDARGPPAL